MFDQERFAAALLQGKYTSFGCYPLFFVTTNGRVLCHDCCKGDCREEIEGAINDRDSRCGWAIEAHGVNWEDAELYCDQCGNRIESAYAEG